jgi:hypothetical protein
MPQHCSWTYKRVTVIGAWLSVIILSVSMDDAHLRETEAMDKNIGTAKLLKDFYYGEDIDCCGNYGISMFT